MGSWSVYCELSNIAITASSRFGIIPLIDGNKTSSMYDRYVPAMLPIFGEYDDYGGMENIEKNDNTEAIEAHFGVSIEEFVRYLVDGKHTYDRDEAQTVADKILNIEEANELSFTFVDGEVYDFLSNTAYGAEGHLDFGDTVILKLLGFKHVNTLPEGRYKYVYKLGGKELFSDGKWCNAMVDGKQRSFHSFDDRYYSNGLTNYFDIAEDKMYLAEKAMWQVKEVYTTARKYAAYLFGLSPLKYQEADERFSELIRKKIVEEPDNKFWYDMVEQYNVTIDGKKPAYKGPIRNMYPNEMEKFGKDISDLLTVLHNARSMSKALVPYALYTTPQCGEHATHLKILEGFTKILQNKLKE